MRHTLSATGLCTILILLFACTKESEENTVQNRLSGNWIFEHKTFIQDSAMSLVQYYTDTAYPGDYFNFQNNGSVMLRMYGEEDSGTWSLDEEYRLRLVRSDGADTTYSVGELDAQTIQIQYFEENNNGTITQMYQLRR